MNEIKDRINTLEGNLDTITNKIEELSVINDELSGIKEDVQDIKDNMMSKYQELKEEISKSSKKSETVYTRWGRTTCPGINSEAVYSGYAAGSHWTHVGAAASMLCLPTDPDWEGGNYSDAHNVHTGLLYGAEYHDGQDRTDKLFGEDHYQQDVPCKRSIINHNDPREDTMSRRMDVRIFRIPDVRPLCTHRCHRLLLC